MSEGASQGRPRHRLRTASETERGDERSREEPSEYSRYRCEVCDYVYDEATGDPREGFLAGTPWTEVPDDWCCPDCGVREKIDFVPVES